MEVKPPSTELKITIPKVSVYIKQGPEAWTFFYIFFGFLVAIGTAIISVLPIDWNEKLGMFFIYPIISFLPFYSGQFQQFLVKTKLSIEEPLRKVG